MSAPFPADAGRFRQKSALARICLAAGLIWLGGLLPGCSAVQQLTKLQKPLVRVENMHITGLDFKTLNLSVEVDIYNPNRLSATLAGFDYDLKLNDHSFLKGNRESGLKIEGESDSTLSIPFTLAFRDVYRVFRSFVQQDSSGYRLDLGLRFDLPILGLTRIPVSKTGKLPLIKLPKVNVAGLKVDKMNFSGADLLLTIELENPNPVSLSLKQFNYDFRVNRASWVTGVADETLQLGAHQSLQIAVPISINFLKMGQTALQLIQGGREISYQFLGDLKVGSGLPFFKESLLPFQKSGQLKITR